MLLQQVMNAVGDLLKKCEHIHTRMNDLQESVNAHHLMSTRLSWRARPTPPAMCTAAMCCEYEARFKVTEVDRGEGWMLKEEWTGHALRRVRDAIYEA